MNNVVKANFRDLQRNLHGGGEPPDNGDMETRVTKLEGFAQETRDRLTRIEVRLDAFATKEDIALTKIELHKTLHDQTWKIVGSMLTFGTLLSGIVFYIARNVH